MPRGPSSPKSPSRSRSKRPWRLPPRTRDRLGRRLQDSLRGGAFGSLPVQSVGRAAGPEGHSPSKGVWSRCFFGAIVGYGICPHVHGSFVPLGMRRQENNEGDLCRRVSDLAQQLFSLCSKSRALPYLYTEILRVSYTLLQRP